jgi:hypothetical protein
VHKADALRGTTMLQILPADHRGSEPGGWASVSTAAAWEAFQNMGQNIAKLHDFRETGSVKAAPSKVSLRPEVLNRFGASSLPYST